MKDKEEKEAKIAQEKKEKSEKPVLQKESVGKKSDISREEWVKVCQKCEKELSEAHTKLADLERLLSKAEIYEQKNQSDLTRVVKQQKELKIQILVICLLPIQ